MRKKKTALYLTPKQVKELKQLAKQLDVPMSQLVRHGIEMVLRHYAKKGDLTP